MKWHWSPPQIKPAAHSSCLFEACETGHMDKIGLVIIKMHKTFNATLLNELDDKMFSLYGV